MLVNDKRIFKEWIKWRNTREKGTRMTLDGVLEKKHEKQGVKNWREIELISTLNEMFFFRSVSFFFAPILDIIHQLDPTQEEKNSSSTFSTSSSSSPSCS